MVSNTMFTEIAALAGDPARWSMLNALSDGRALTATELARVSGVSPQTASGHLGRLTQAELLVVEKQGRHRYHRLASPAVARMLEGIMQVAAGRTSATPRRLVTGPRDAALRYARSCYDHLAGRLGVALADALVAAGHVELGADGGLVTDSGRVFFTRLGTDLEKSAGSKRLLCRPCLDWSERRPHLAGVIGAVLRTHSLASGWIRNIGETRAVTITPKGQRAFQEKFGVSLS
jgi:DNA-binding transcriptional ArsR family regulator